MKSQSTLVFSNELPPVKKLGEELLLIYDQILAQKSPVFKKWSQQIALKYAVKAGEQLKDIEQFPRHIKAITKLTEQTSVKKLTIVVVGGGSLGDFGGFVASILKRGVRLIHIPSTWLAAIDSAHGGKTALNVGGAKNQIGTFYPAEQILMVRSVLMSQPEARAYEGFGELVKIALIEGGKLWNSLAKERQVNSKVLWKHLEAAVKAKYKVVAKDPEEKKGIRHVLNLGHTVGHVLESYYELPHGIAINYGLDFALRFSVQKKIMKPAEAEKIYSEPIMGFLLSPLRDDMVSIKSNDLKEYRRLLLSDKKKTKAATLRFVFVQKPGKTVIQEVGVDDLLIEICRQREEELHG
jgi:3-dehydroquinate synthase